MLSRTAAASLVLIVLACTPSPDVTQISTSTPPETSAAVDPSPFQPGDTVGVWRVVQVDVRRDPVENGWIGEVRFSGETSVSGTFQRHPDSELNALCFFVDEAARGALPRFPNDVRRPWFCFANEDAVRRVAKAGSRARIRVGDYHYRYSHTDGYNTVTFLGFAV